MPGGQPEDHSESKKRVLWRQRPNRTRVGVRLSLLITAVYHHFVVVVFAVDETLQTTSSSVQNKLLL